MTENQEILYTLYKGSVEYSGRVFNHGQWTLNNQVRIDANIIGKSHHIQIRGDEESFTEFIAYPESRLPSNPMDQIPLRVGDSHVREFCNASIMYWVNLKVIDHLLADMDAFAKYVGEGQSSESLTHGFGSHEAFTGILINSKTNHFYSIHTYPEHSFSVLSKTHIFCPD